MVPSDLYPGNTVVWLHKETPFKAKILETAGKWLIGTSLVAEGGAGYARLVPVCM